MGTVPRPGCTCLAVKLVITLFVKYAVVMGLLEGKPLAVPDVVAHLNAFL